MRQKDLVHGVGGTGGIAVAACRGNWPNETGVRQAREKRGGGVGADGRRGNWQKGAGQELCGWNLRHPPHSINSNTHAQMMHENPFIRRARREDGSERGGKKRWERDTKGGLKDLYW